MIISSPKLKYLQQSRFKQGVFIGIIAYMPRETLNVTFINPANVESIYSRPFLMLEGLFERHPHVIPIAQQMSEYPKEFWHMTMVAQVYESVLGSLFIQGYLVRKDLGLYDLGTLGAFLHDIGKFGIDPSGIDKSLAIMDYVADSQTAVGPGKDLRPDVIRATQHLHPLVGGYIVRLMGQTGLIPKNQVNTIASPVFGHHETNDNGFKTSYPRPDRRLENSQRTFIDLLVQLADSAVSMREKRSYRSELDFSHIESELRLYLEDSELLKHIGSVIKGDLKTILIKEVMKVIGSVDGIIRMIPDLSKIVWSGIKDDDREHTLLKRLITEVWQTKQKRIFEAFEHNLKSAYNHSTRR